MSVVRANISIETIERYSNSGSEYKYNHVSNTDETIDRKPAHVIMLLSLLLLRVHCAAISVLGCFKKRKPDVSGTVQTACVKPSKFDLKRIRARLLAFRRERVSRVNSDLAGRWRPGESIISK